MFELKVGLIFKLLKWDIGRFPTERERVNASFLESQLVKKTIVRLELDELISVVSFVGVMVWYHTLLSN